MQPKVSIIMSNFNCEEFIGKTIESVLAQTYKNFEFLIVDDCSTDGSRDVIDRYNDDRIKKFYLEKNEHMCFGFNYAISKATGEYYARIDSDDTWLPEKLEKQVKYMQENPECGACFTLVNVVDENDRKLTSEDTDRVELLETGNMTQPEWIRHFYFKGSCLCHPSVLMRKSVIDDVGVYNYSLIQIQDYEMWVRIAKKYPIYVLQERLVNYRWFMSGKNASAPSKTTNTRSDFEFAYVLSRYFDDLSDEMFIKAFGNDFIRKGTTDSDEILCERALLLLQPVFCGNRHKIGGMVKLIDLLQNDKTRQILRGKYGVTQKNFYELSASPVFYSDESIMQIASNNRSFKEKVHDVMPRPIWKIGSKIYRIFVKRK